MTAPWPPEPIDSTDYWRVPKRPVILIAIALLALYAVPRMISVAMSPPIVLPIVNQATQPRIVEVIAGDDITARDAVVDSLRIPPASQVLLDEVDTRSTLTLLVFDEACRLLTPWPFTGSPPIRSGVTAFVGDDGTVAWGDAADVGSLPSVLRDSRRCDR